jgi:hypothetical protein
VYVAHVTGCLFLYLGTEFSCKIEEEAVYDDDNAEDECTPSWVYANDFESKPISTKYIFAFYWIFEVITTVGYGDYSGGT